ncbi:MAG: NapC/NirT family cytochrome c [Firmicutes bacterium]|nr:NapC/NirT family cytochrome c [Bacillota bacterium]
MTKKGKTILIVVIVAFIALSVGMSMFFETNYACGKLCHEMTPYYNTWAESSHAHVNCHECHSWPGFGGFFKTKLVGLEESIKHFTGNYATPIQGEPVIERCIECHEDYREIKETEEIRVDHAMHADLGIDCMACHAGMVHGHNGEGEVTPSHDSCNSCHDTDNYENCSKCHKW